MEGGGVHIRQDEPDTHEIETDRGRPFLVAARILETVDLSYAYGLDVLGWLEGGLVDLLVTGEVSLAPQEDVIALGHRYGVPVYPCLRRTMRRGTPESNTLESFRAQALSAWRHGCDGIYLFNLFPGEAACPPGVFTELGDPAELEFRDKLYSPDPIGVTAFARYFGDLRRYAGRSIPSPAAPVVVTPREPKTLPLYVADSFSPDRGAGPPFCSAQIVCTSTEVTPALDVSVNGDSQ